MKFLFLLVSLLSFSAWGQNVVSGEGRFYAADEDSLGFVKTQLHYQAVRDVISKELKTMGLDEKLFWQKYEERFGDYFKSIADQVKEKYADDKGEVPRDKKADYDKALRARRLSVLSRYGRLQGVVTSYSVKRMTRSPQVPQSRFYQIDAKTDRRAINELYLKFTANDQDRKYKTLYVSLDFKLTSMTWNDAGVEIGTDFTDVVREHWQKWLEDKFGTQIEQVVFTDETLERQLRDFLLIPRDLVFSQRIESGDSSLDRFASGLWLKIDVGLEKLREDVLVSKREIAVEGDLLLIELKTNRSVYHDDLAKEKKLFHTDEARAFSSSLASMVYSKPLPSLEKAKKAMGEVSQAKHDYHLKISSLASIQDLMDVGSLLSSKGVIHQARAEVVGFDGKNGTLSLSFRGGRTELSNFLKSLAGQNVSAGKVLQVNPEVPTEMVLMLVEPSAPATKTTKKSSGQQG